MIKLSRSVNYYWFFALAHPGVHRKGEQKMRVRYTRQPLPPLHTNRAGAVNDKKVTPEDEEESAPCQ